MLVNILKISSRVLSSTLNKHFSQKHDGFSPSKPQTDNNSHLTMEANGTSAEKEDKNELIPTQKERLAYTIEFSAKIIYPLSFVIYNIVYWTSYYG